MKKRILFLGLIISSITGLLQAQGSLTPELLYYKFDGSGTTVPNYASAPPPGTATATIQGGITQGGSGTLCNGALIGSGAASSTDYLNTGWAPNVGAGPWTISVRVSGISTNGTLYYIFGDLGTNSFRCFTNGVAGSTNWIIRGGGLTDLYINGGALLTPTMITFVYDPTLANLKGYLNGVLVSTVAQGAVNITGTGPFKVMGYSSNVGAPAGGLIDEFRFYNRALTAGEITQLYNPYATAGFLGSDTYTCPGDTTVLDLTWPTTTVLWSDGSTADSLLVTVADTFAVTVSGACGSGMDSIVYLSGVTSSSISPTSCATYTSPSGAIYSASGLYSDTIPNMVGCDSLISINLNILSPSTSTISPSICGLPDYTAPSGAVYSSSGTYNDTIPNTQGCDSVITINLTLASNTTATINPAVCGSSYMAPSGASYTSSGTFNDTISNVFGCDSVITINLTLDPNTSSNINPTQCGGVYTAPSGSIHTSTSVFNDTIPNFAGCDSVITINLTINNVNTGVSQAGTNGQNLSALAIGTYQWINCPSLTPIVGETFGNFTATANGLYAVIVTENGCTDTSACFTVSGLGINQNPLADMVKLYPNPTTGAFTINVGMVNESFTIELINNVGQVVKNALFTNSNIGTFEIDGPSGLYFVRITNSDGEKVVLRVIKE